MSQETVIYITNIIIAIILAGLLSHSWFRQGRSETMRCWMIAAWVLALADLLFAARPELPHGFGRIAPTLLVTVGHAVLFAGSRKTAASSSGWVMSWAIVAVHGAGLVYFLFMEQHADWRKVFNGVVWAAFALASGWYLRRAPEPFWKPLSSPANVFLLHGLFHCGRLILGSIFTLQDWPRASDSLQILGDLEVSFFMVALFVGILVASLQLRNAELTEALNEVHTLSGLLPICAWCKKVRDDDGYWQRVEDYFASRSQIQFTHGICNDCFKALRSKKPPR